MSSPAKATHKIHPSSYELKSLPAGTRREARSEKRSLIGRVCFFQHPEHSVAMACTTVATVSVAAAPVLAQVGESRVLSRQSTVVLGAAPGTSFSSKLVANKSRVVMSAAPQKDINMAGLTTIALVAATIVPEIAEAAAPGVSPSLKNLLLSVVAGGVVLAGIGVAVAGVSTFDPVKRR